MLEASDPPGTPVRTGCELSTWWVLGIKLGPEGKNAVFSVLSPSPPTISMLFETRSPYVALIILELNVDQAGLKLRLPCLSLKIAGMKNKYHTTPDSNIF